ncbi:hypothetical protein PEX1_057270 [Penicillium expansum]|uniref:Uncharacterized protein n=1 Tax=Penicillium expansum TaxID=27334 RepID=A0A0A2IJT9_PENEN|nr:hypothetical protein PEX2_067840 [Penicillium expansum]KAJ5511317.1 hypothetical protein N7453_003420 [Penicillium expansum]KGO42701.1 hypothetical protein PEXP_022300 [Penicillium expansum]KGO58274.1 hypothetical protein PEX2_067840 [Penicillium expansum]KGO70756.1 hypothetical protein PEX1_057270 [Penicillium expansum]
MEKHHPISLSFEEILALKRSEGITDYEAWRQAMVQYSQQRSEHTIVTTLATTSSEIPLSESVLTLKTATPPGAPTIHLNQLPVNAAGENHILSTCKPDDPSAKERLRENTKLLVDSGVAEKLSIDRTLDPPLLEQIKISNVADSDTDTETTQKRAQEAHTLYWDAMAAADKTIGRRL